MALTASPWISSLCESLTVRLAITKRCGPHSAVVSFALEIASLELRMSVAGALNTSNALKALRKTLTTFSRVG